MIHFISREFCLKSSFLAVLIIILQILTTQIYIYKQKTVGKRYHTSTVNLNHNLTSISNVFINEKPKSNSTSPKKHRKHREQDPFYIGDIGDIYRAEINIASTGSHFLDWWGYNQVQKVELPIEIVKHVNFNRYGSQKILRKDKILTDNLNTTEFEQMWKLINQNLTHGFALPYLKL